MRHPENIIKTFEQLDKIEDKAYEEAVRLDLFFIRKAIPGIDGWLLIVSSDCYYMMDGVYWLDRNTYENWPEYAKEHMKRHYGFKI